MNDTIRVATFNASLNRGSEGQLITDLSTPNNNQAKTVAEIIQRTDADVILINEFDFDAAGTAAQLFLQNYLGVSQNGAPPVSYPYVFQAPSNTGVPSGFDLDNNGTVGGPNDAFGFGFFPGQFGMLVLSKHPIDEANIRTFQNFRWKDMPGALLPDNPATPEANDWYSPQELAVFRLSSKSHWDIPVIVNGEVVHVLAAHPTPPVFDGPEDRNGTRNHDEIRLWSDYVTPGKGDYIYDDEGTFGGLGEGRRFVIVGDYNADPFDGDSRDFAVQQLLENALIDDSVKPSSPGGTQQAALQGGANATHQGDPAFDTADFADGTPGNLRVDYVLPSAYGLNPVDAKVFWPLNTDPLFPLVGTFNPALPGGFPSSDHRLVWSDIEIVPTAVAQGRNTVTGLSFLGEVTFPTGTLFDGTTVGGLSGLTYDAADDVFYAISDDRSQINPARFYELEIDLADGALDDGDIQFTGVTTITDAGGNSFPTFSLDPEGIALTRQGTLIIASEGDTSRSIDPFINIFDLSGKQIGTLPVPQKFLVSDGDANGVRNNLAFESLTISPNGRYLYTATENALSQDGPVATADEGSPSRIVVYDLETGLVVHEFIYETDPVAAPPAPGAFATNGLVELFALDDSGTLLALERSFTAGVGNSVKLYEVLTQGATDVKGFDGVDGFDIDQTAQKRLLLDLSDLGLTLDNLEALSFGPMVDGKPTLIIASDNNFSATQFTQFLAFSLDIDLLRSASPTVETPPVIRFGDTVTPDPEDEADPDDPAIWVNPTDASKSLVITTEKNTGLTVYNLDGEEVQAINPADARFNNVDLVYGFELAGQSVDIAVVSDRENDTLGICSIDPATGLLTDVTAANLLDEAFSIFGEDDGEQTAYGLTTYTSLVDGTVYAFVSQRDGSQLAQLALTDDGTGKVTAQVVRTLQLPVPTGDPEDSQSEGMVVDREKGLLYVALEGEAGIVRFSAEPGGGDNFTLIQSLDEDYLTPDIEGLTIYYGTDGTGYLLASSQGDHTYAVFSRDGSQYLGSFVVGDSGGIDSAEESDGADVINVPLGPKFPFGMLVVQDGSNEAQVVFEDPDPDEDEIQNYNANFKYIPWQNVAGSLDTPLVIDTTSYDPRSPGVQSLIGGVAASDTNQASTVLSVVTTLPGTVTFEVSTDPTFATVVASVQATVTTILEPVEVTVTGLKPNTAYFVRVIDEGGDTVAGDFTTLANVATPGDDSLSGSADDDTIAALAGDDTVASGGGDDTVDGGDGADSVTAGSGNDTVEGGSGNDTVGGGSGNDSLSDVGGSDGINAGSGSDTVASGTGDDTIRAGSGDDSVNGGNGADAIDGGPGNDTVSGSKGGDTIEGGDGLDSISGGGGGDLVEGGDDADTLTAGAGDDTVSGDDGDDEISGGSDDDMVTGGSGADTLSGNDGDDRIEGNHGDDKISGGTGDDKISGGLGSDTLSGKDGDDTFVFSTGEGVDTITDFAIGEDLIGLAGGLTLADIVLTPVAGGITEIEAAGVLLARVDVVSGERLSETDIILI
jgi:3-phytase/alkaline phosphatase D